MSKDLTFSQLYALSECFTRAHIAGDLLYDAAESTKHVPGNYPLLSKIEKRFKEISQEIADLNGDLKVFARSKERPKEGGE